MTESPAWHCNTVRCKMFNPNIFYLPVMPAQIYGRHILPKFRFTFMKNVNIQNSLLRRNVLKQDPPVTKLVTWHFVCLWLIEIRHFIFVLKKESGYLSRYLYRNLKPKPPFWLKTVDVSTNFTRVIFFVIYDQNSDIVLIMSRKPGQKKS